MNKWYTTKLLMSLNWFNQMGTQGYLFITIGKLS
jgi:hypothetical protein